MLRVVVFCLALQIAHGACPSQLPLYKDGQCRGYSTGFYDYSPNALDRAITSCHSIQAYPVSIHDDEQQTYWDSMSGYFLILGLKCNTNTNKWYWADGTSLDFKPPSYDQELDEDCKTGSTWILYGGHWTYGYSSNPWVVVYCIAQLSQPEPSTDCGSFNEDGDDSSDTTCYQIAKHAENWKDAQAICHSFGAEVASVHSAQENSYIRRLAVSAGSTNGLMIGGTVAGKGVDFGWVDGSEWDYTNFYPGFPIDGLGECLTMDTLTTAGQWMNTDCSAKLPVACARPFHDTPETAGCTGGPWKEGQIIYSPGFPNDASVPCDYFLTVPTGKLVKLEILLLEANGCCDHLLLTDGYTGGTIIANLTGDGLTGKYYYTTTSNTMRVSWQPNGGVNVRGLMMSYWTK